MNQKYAFQSMFQSGLTLVELIVCMGVLAILANLALPTMADVLAKWQRDRATRALVDHLQLARASAIKSTRNVVMCNSIDGVSCASTSQKDWTRGWLVFQDHNANKVFDGTDILVASAGPADGISTLTSSNGVRSFVFMPSGLMASGMSTLVITPKRGTSMKIVVNRVGRFRLTEDPT